MATPNKSGRINEAKWIEERQRWQINVRIPGDRRTFVCSTPGTKGKIEAERKADKWLEAPKNRDRRIGDLWNEFLEFKKLHGDGTDYYVTLESIGRIWILPKLKNKRCSSIITRDWQDCIDEAFKKGKARRTITNIRGAITNFYSYADEIANAPIPPIKKLRIPKEAYVGERKILQPTAIKTLFAIDWVKRYKEQVPSFYIYAWRFLVISGLRRGELAGIKKEDIKNGVLYIRRSVNKRGEITAGKTKNAVRKVPLSPIMLSIMADQKAMLKKMAIVSPWLFPGEEGGMMVTNNLYKQWKTYARQHGLNASLHELRHTMVSIVGNSVPDATLKRIVGHSATMDTQGVYGHEVDGELQAAAVVIDSIFDKILTAESP